MMRLLAALLLIVVAGDAAAREIRVPIRGPAALYSPKYDHLFRSAVDRWWPHLPECSLWKAQVWQESRFNPAAVSPAGARGLVQFMGPTWRDTVRQMGLTGSPSPHDEVAVEGGTFYMARLTMGWQPGGRTPLQRHELALASYNAGMGSILGAQRRCSGARQWRDIQVCLPDQTGERSAHETQTYVAFVVDGWWPLLQVHGGC